MIPKMGYITSTWRKASNRRDLLASLVWAIFLSIFFFAIYGACNVITAGRSDVGQIGFAWERFTPFVPVMILPYMSIDLFFFFAPFLCAGARERRTHGRRIIMAITVAGICFLLFPMRMSLVRPEPTGLLAPIFKFLYGFDRPFNLVPSLHIALICLLWVIYVPRAQGLVRRGIQAWFILIGLSALLTWQHQIVDVFTGLFLGLACLHSFPGRSLAEDGMQNHARNFPLAWRYGLGAVFLFAIAFLLRPWGLLLLWPGVSLAIMAWAYCGAGAAVFGKHDSRLPISAYIVLGPYLFGIYLAWRYHRQRDAPFGQIVPGLFVGRRLNPVEARALVDRGICAVLDLTAEWSEAGPLRRITYCNIPVLDFTSPTNEQLTEAAAFIQKHIVQGSVFVHCGWGYSRSPCASAAWLLSDGKAQTVPDAIAMTRSARPKLVMREELEEALRNFHFCAQRPQLHVELNLAMSAVASTFNDHSI